ncbi:MAG: AmpG family muropeptide MFS transporter [Gammaproteobacteria bacterium]|nr:AmpG family muropeptide MFS transporter [Gammaproteobacteria bacterium]
MTESEQVDLARESPGWRFYLQEKILVVFFLGFSGGLPFPLVYATLTAWLNDAGLQKSTISTFAWIGFAYAFKFLWSPLVDRLELPILTRRLGRRRAWLLLSQISIGISLVALSGVNPALATGAFALVAIVVAFSSATQDMAIDAYRIECAEDEMQALLAAAYQYGYRISIIVGGAGALYIADFVSWEIAYQCMAACMVIGVGTTLLCKEPTVPETAETIGHIFDGGFVPWFKASVVGPFVDFFDRYGTFALTMLAFIALFRISDYVLGILANPFYLDIGFTKSQIASVAKLYGLWVALFGIAGGGWAVIKFGQSKTLIAAATLIATTNLFFAVLAYTGPNIWALVATISFDNFAQGFSGTVFIAYLSSLTNVSFTATQYALFSSLSVFFGKLIAGYSGDVQELVGYVGFFVYAAALGIPSIILAIVVVRHTPAENRNDHD